MAGVCISDITARTKALKVITDKALLSGMLPSEYMLKTLRSEEATHEQRTEATVCAAPLPPETDLRPIGMKSIRRHSRPRSQKPFQESSCDRGRRG
jgi:hypothetical protein